MTQFQPDEEGMRRIQEQVATKLNDAWVKGLEDAEGGTLEERVDAVIARMEQAGASGVDRESVQAALIHADANGE